MSHAAEPESIYNNPNLYPQIFPWLFPYGLGGIGNGALSEKAHKEFLLMYYDKRFQRDIAFPFVAFSHEQIKASTTGAFLLTERAKFKAVAERLLNVNQEVLADIGKRMSEGETVKALTADEKMCFQIIKDLDHVSGKVKGSITSKKYMRNEIWSLIVALGAPLWYITLSPADNKHPICLYFAGQSQSFSPWPLSADKRYHLIAENPVAGARFFHFMTTMFIKHVLGVGTAHSGLYGDTSGYYGTVEQQGRLTLHLHMLLWIKGTMSPDDMRQRITDPNSDFRRSLIEYLESTHAGDFVAGSREAAEANVDIASAQPGYHDPTETMPEAPPGQCLTEKCNGCEQCKALASWWTRFRTTVDDIILRSNIHKCTTNKNKDGSQNKLRSFVGCLDNIWGKCKARFPRPLFTKTEVDDETGHINMKKKEPWINTITYVVTYLFRCNIDITSLRSGTAIKGVLLYVTNYVTKPTLKTHVVFETVVSMFRKNTEILTGTESRQQKARKLITKIVNSLSAKLEMGAPMICTYLLGLLDHYTSHMFTPFYWQSFVNNARSPWTPHNDIQEGESHTEHVTLLKKGNQIIGMSPVSDYISRPVELESICLYDWIARGRRVKKPKPRKTPAVRDDEALHSASESEDGNQIQVDLTNTSKQKLFDFVSDHPLSNSHCTQWLPKDAASIPNFIGSTLPRSDQGDREYYCSTMLTLFKPWRTGHDLKQETSLWNDAFTAHNFGTRYTQLMRNMNIRYECLDAQDDFHAEMKKGSLSLPNWLADEAMLKDLDQSLIDDYMEDDCPQNLIEDIGTSVEMGRKTKARNSLMNAINRVLTVTGWTECDAKLLTDNISLKPAAPITVQPASQWKAAVISKRAQVLEQRAQHLQNIKPANNSINAQLFVANEVKVVTKAHLTQSFETTKWGPTINAVAEKYQLNEEQERAYRIVANHSCSESPEQLKMNMSGMAGTGKTRVLEALIELFTLKKESHRLVVVAPTGSAAALLGGSTYHYMFGINSDGEKTSATQLAQVKTRLQGVDYVFMDEVSMLCCRDMYLISARLAQINNNPQCPFGGLDMIFAGDFAQLPPAIGQENASLYSRTVGINPKSLYDQEAAMGKALWHQVTTVVILRKNMRQKNESPEDTKFRTALENMRYKACTPADIAFLNSRVSSPQQGKPNIRQKQFRNVSIITALNAHKDEINRLGTLRFAAETGQALHHFFSQDSVPSKEAKERKKDFKGSYKHSVKHATIPLQAQKMLWNQSPCANTKLVPGKLSLCIGMPVMIRLNSATELCMTKGQEAVVHSWQASKTPDGTAILDTLFVRLLNPPSQVQLDNLPPNVVPLTRTSVTTSCLLPDDTTLTISRNQVEVLPNWAMTDYASQGKTRAENVVDLSHSRSHQAYYTALSRSSTAAGTLILTGFHPHKITGGASGALRQEFRELEILDSITRLQFEGKLPVHMVQADRRNSLIAWYRQLKGKDCMPPTVHKAIQWGERDPFLEWPHSNIEWAIVDKSTKVTAPSHKPVTPNMPIMKNLLPFNESKKHALTPAACITQPFKKLRLSHVSHLITDNLTPVGTRWSNNSCAYDAVITILFNTWQSLPDTGRALWANLRNNPMASLLDGFQNHASVVHAPTCGLSLDTIRDNFRQLLAHISGEFEFGEFTSVHSILEKLLETGEHVTSSSRQCSSCEYSVGRETNTTSCLVYTFASPGMRLQTHLNNQEQLLASTCPMCGQPQIRRIVFQGHPPLLAFQWGGAPPLFNTGLQVNCNGVVREYLLRGIVYYANQHFTAHFLNSNGSSWHHDGMARDGVPILQRPSQHQLTTAIAAVYALSG
jgi:hypothetical protein